MLPRCSFSGVSQTPTHACQEGWVGHPLDPLGALFDTLAEASVLPDALGKCTYFPGRCGEVALATTAVMVKVLVVTIFVSV